MKIAVYVIARNESAHVARFMSSVADADMVIVGDTGSTDNTVELFRQAGAVVHELSIVPWRFDAARNAVLDLIPDDVDLCFSIDVDELPTPEWRGVIEAAWQPGINRIGYHYVWGFDHLGRQKGRFTRTLIHARHGFRWRRAVHEILDATGPEIYTMADEMYVLHFPDSAKSRSQYLPLLEIATAEDPLDSQISFWLASEYLFARLWAEALTEFERYLALPTSTWAPERAGAWRRMAHAWRSQEQPGLALEYLRRACDEAPGEREPWVELAQDCLKRGLWQEGLEAAERALTITSQPQHYLVWDEAWRSLPEQLAAQCAFGLGRVGLARHYIRRALAADPGEQHIVTIAAEILAGEESIVDTSHDTTVSEANTPPFLVSVTLTGNAGEMIGEAIASVVDWVDACLVIDTGVTDDTLSIARAVAGAKYREMAWAWENDFAAARNTALDAAASLGAQWAVMVDTDERIIAGDAAATVRDTLRGSTSDLLLIDDIAGHYGKERFFRLPRRGRYIGPTHEAFVDAPQREHFPGMRFTEVAKSPEQYRAKFERDREILERHTEQHPDDPRWHYYLGETLKNLGELEAAIVSYGRCHELPGWAEQAAWAAYKAAECSTTLGRHADAVSWCARGLTRNPATAELAWLAGYACWQLGEPAQAAAWAYMAVATGATGNAVHLPQRIGFRHPPGLYEGPYDVLRYALRALGNDLAADEAERMYHVALELRNGRTVTQD